MRGYAVHAEQVVVPRNLITKVPENVVLEEAAFATLGSIAMQGVRLSGVQIGESVAVLGLGLIGLLTTQILKAAGAVVIAYDPKKSQTDLAAKMGADHITNEKESLHNICSMVSDKYGVDKVLITASTKSDDPVITAGEIARDKGKVVVVGAVGLNMPRKPYYEKEIEFISSVINKTAN